MHLTFLDDILPKVNKARFQDKSIVLATGIFDLLHQEHIKFLKRAKQAGDILLVGIETDERVRQLKGKGRPINSQHTRVLNLQKLNIADYIFVLPEQFNHQKHWEDFIARLRPNIYAVSSHTPYQENKSAIIQKYGGQLKIVHLHNPNISTTKTLKLRGL